MYRNVNLMGVPTYATIIRTVKLFSPIARMCLRRATPFLLFLVLFLTWHSYVGADTLAQRQEFLVNGNYDESGRQSVSSTLRFLGKHAYYYVDDLFWGRLNPTQQASFSSGLEALSNEFDGRIYPTITNAWGPESNPGIDNDSRIVIVLQALKSGYGGYFDSIHGYPKLETPRSNAREMIFISAESVGTGVDKSFLTHEFQHLISFNQKEVLRGASEEVWLNEVRSEYSVHLAGYNVPFENSPLARRVAAFLTKPSDSLMEWDNESADYAQAVMFGQYLTGRFGTDILSKSLYSAKTGIASLNEVLANLGIPQRFEEVYSDWILASYLNVPNDSRFGYANVDLQRVKINVPYRGPLYSELSQTVSSLLKPWQPTWYEFSVFNSPEHGIEFRFSSDPAQRFMISYAVLYQDGSFDTGKLALEGSQRTLYILHDPNKQIQKVVIAPVSVSKTEGFTGSEQVVRFGIEASFASQDAIERARASASSAVVFSTDPASLSDGSLIKRRGKETEFYVVQGRYKRHLTTQARDLYAHLINQSITEVNEETFGSYQISNYVRSANDQKVYAVWPDGTKHWLRMSGEYFTASGRDWNSIFIISDAELRLYKAGTDIKR